MVLREAWLLKTTSGKIAERIKDISSSTKFIWLDILFSKYKYFKYYSKYYSKL